MSAKFENRMVMHSQFMINKTWDRPIARAPQSLSKKSCVQVLVMLISTHCEYELLTQYLAPIIQTSLRLRKSIK